MRVADPAVPASLVGPWSNRLAGAKSPYLRHHGQDPVDWWPWCDEAFTLARALDRPVFLSIGYAACHWCHVMQRESFADPQVAALMNGGFVNVKVDREEHPEVDALYMQALLTLHGDSAALAKHARTWLNVMIAQERWRQALEFWAEIRAADAQLWPSDPDQVLELLDKAHELGRPELSLPFASGFSRVYPKHPAVGAVHLRVARALAGPMGRAADALKLLEMTRDAFPKSKALGEVEAMIEELKRDPRLRG